eukprot:1147543-Pelagomonas_calceolata.AAC.3
MQYSIWSKPPSSILLASSPLPYESATLQDHLAIYPSERARIEKAGGSISEGRLQGKMQASMAWERKGLHSCTCLGGQLTSMAFKGPSGSGEQETIIP